MAIDGWRPSFEAELVEADNIAVACRVGFYVAPGDHWGQYVSYIVHAPSFEPNRGNTVPPRTL